MTERQEYRTIELDEGEAKMLAALSDQARTSVTKQVRLQAAADQAAQEVQATQKMLRAAVDFVLGEASHPGTRFDREAGVIEVPVDGPVVDNRDLAPGARNGAST